MRDTLGLASEVVVKTEDALEAEANQSGTAMSLTDDITGTTSVDGLELGLYLVVETEVPENVTSTVTPFLVSLLMRDTQTADEEKLSALKCYMGKRDLELEREMTDALVKLYEKYVPAPVGRFAGLS